MAVLTDCRVSRVEGTTQLRIQNMGSDTVKTRAAIARQSEGRRNPLFSDRGFPSGREN
ncbi:hypothetical protein [Lyngbya sp. CCY1209]|uniref:hypothetical protein n=1 Tax=Lyngbya sp. CCY1209 TaxID=2886103 RepID=UPI002D21464C|nr:hypothetical protein [Lyngbya sp. CCY1209]MEB3885489.1 hypothetical protein [Lyngbya sp. CCY1209]